MALGPTDPVIADSPFAAGLGDEIARLYDLIDTPRVSETLDVCQCNCCMIESTRQKIIATDMRVMPADLVKEYSNSAHDIMGNADDIRAFLPRYLALMAADIEVDSVGVGVELHRFGKAIRRDAAFLNAVQTASYDQIAALMIGHFGWRAAHDHDDVASVFNLIDIFLTGGVPTDVVFAACDAVFDREDIGIKAFVEFYECIAHRPKRMGAFYGVDLFGIGYAPKQVRDAFAAWLRSDAMTQRLHAVCLSADLDDEQLLLLDHAMTVFAGMDGAAFHNHRPEVA